MVLVSPTRLNKLFTCPRNFYFSVVLGKAEPRSEIASLGTAAHELIELGLKGQDLHGKVIDVANKHNLSPVSRLELLEMLPNIEKFVEKVKNLKHVAELIIEREFKSEKLGFLNNPLVGHPDLIIRMETGDVIIVDHKTTRKQIKDGNDIPVDYRRQLILYGYLYLEENPNTRSVTLVIHHVRNGETVRWLTMENPDRIKEMARNIAGKLSRILQEQKDKWEAKPGWLCRFCPFVVSCSEGKEYLNE